ncbi:glycerol-3-phosphate 1-O-acyltransferase PlsY [Mycoplasma sp. ES3225-GEN-MYC]|uniref:Glycerol-3-phosphate acyltransferase n=1 Tax=Mycoplasma miroungigenitalium TaxID=754515 RepID=A0A6M4JE13_9MOLU|nr:glycerol-3-phosphate 1-O-acyltransferase PlsY [Mycoplasma miroungigenitalium]MBU4691477.1 glycerol-3-phosphate 1-O-acyltransferase PlsY [Mycoplasma miroungigenitalium]QJR43312.1 glycerol-3-phosphate acyltransferase [Mycoplasma miroungigenitalium]
MINYPKTPIVWLSIIALNFALLVFGYIIGSFNTAIILSKKLKNDDVRNHFSQNAGATNSLRTYGKKFALIVFIIDFMKVLIPTLIFATLQNHLFCDFSAAYWMSPQSIGLGVILGHCFPIFFKFKGGKGVACSSAFILSINPVLWLIAFVVFFATVIISKKVSLGSLLTAGIIAPLVFIPWFSQGITGYWFNFINLSNCISPQCLQPYWFVSAVYFLIASILIICLHRSNIKRLISGTESQLKLKK